MLALDVSGSMGSAMGGTSLTCREASAAMAMVTARVEKNWACVGFTSGGRGYGGMHGGDPSALTELKISPRQRLDDIVKSISGLSFGGTDCSLPMLHAIEHKLAVDVFQIYTDNETWAGHIHPFQALKQYRQKSGRNAKLVVVGMTATEFSIADPSDAGMLDVVGFDTSAPNVMADFARS
jgi:60 kDa SS-A/Ro ribonucleoprotein